MEKRFETLESKFGSLESKFDSFETTMDKRFDALEEKFDRRIDDLAIITKEGFDRVDARFEKVDERFDRIENISIGGHARRLDNLEDRVRVIETKTKIKR